MTLHGASAPDRTARLPRAWWLAGLAWFLLVVIVYYRRLWQLMLEGFPGADPYAIRSAALPTVLLAAPLVVVAITFTAWRARVHRPARPVAAVVVACAVLLLALAALARRSHPIHGALLPWLPEAAARGASGLLGAALVGAASWWLGGLVLRAIGWREAGWDTRQERRSALRERMLFRLAAGFGTLAYLSLALSLTGVYRPAVIRPIVIALAALGAASAARSVRGAGAKMVAAALRSADAPLAAPDLVWALIAVLGVGLAFIGALAPEVEYDALWYHLWLPHLWLQHGRPVDVLSEYVSLYPMTWELLYGDAMTLGGTVAAKLIHFACLPLTAAAAWQLTDRFFRPASAWLAAAVLVTVPVVCWEGTTAYIDLALALYVTLGLYALLRYLGTEEPRWLWLTALSFGLAVSIKHLGLIVLALVGVGLFVHYVRLPGRRLRALTVPGALAAVALLLALPWYWRAWVASGNPFFPELYKLFGARPATRWDVITDRGLDAFKARFGYPRRVGTLALLPWNLTQHAAAFGGSLGPLFLAAFPWLGPRGLRPARWLLLVTVGYILVWASPVSSFQARFLVPIVPALAVLCAHALTRASKAFARAASARRTAYVVLAVVLLLGLPPFIPLHEGDRDTWRGWLTHATRLVPLPVVVGRQSADEYLRASVATYGAWRYLASSSPADAVVLDVGGGDNFYASRDRIPVDATLARGAWAEGDGAGATVLATLARLHVTHVVIDKEWLRRMAAERAALGSDAFRRQALSLEYEDGRALVYRVMPAKSVTMQRSFRPIWRNASTGW